MTKAFLLAGLLAPDATVSTPQSWQLDQQSKQCIALRERSADRLGVAITFRPFEKFHEVTVIAPRSGARDGTLPLTLSVPAANPGRELTARVREPKGTNNRVITVSLTVDQLRAAAATGTLSVMVAGAQSYDVPMKGASKVLTALAECEQRIIAAMGFTRNWVTPPAEANDFSGLVRSDDYPISRVENNRQGGVAVLLEIDQTGAVSRCVSYELFGDPMFERVVCGAVKKRARFTPARNSGGNAVKSYYLSPMIWFVMN